MECDIAAAIRMRLADDQAGVRTTALSVAGMSCGACVRHVTKALDGMTGVVHVDVDLGRNEATVEHLSAFTDAVALIAAIRDAGYDARVLGTVDDDGSRAASVAIATSCACGCCGGANRVDSPVVPLGTIR